MQEKRFQNRIIFFTYALTILVIWVHSVNLAPEVLAAAGFTVNTASALVDALGGAVGLSGAAGLGGAASAGAGKFFSTFSPSFYQFACSLERFFTDTLGQTAVPGFFMVSAYLFFRTLPKDSGKPFPVLKLDWVLQKWKRRVFSLFLPFVIWNLLYYFLHLLSGWAGALFHLPQAEQVPLDVQTLVSAALHYTYNPVFWYLFQLCLLTLLAPLLFYLVRGKKTGAAVLFLSFLAAVFWEKLPVHVVNEDALFYYLLGIYGALHKKPLIEAGRHAGRALLLAAGLLVLWYLAFETGILPEAFCMLPLAVIARAVLFRAAVPLVLYFLLTLFMERGAEKAQTRKELQEPKNPPAFMRITFFIYATHYLIIKLINAFLFSVLSKEAVLTGGSMLILLLVYFLLPTICTAAAYTASCVLKACAPRLWGLLSGGR